MEPRDARQLTREAQAELRRIAVRLHERKGLKPEEIGTLLDVHPDTVGRWLTAWRRRGEAVFEASTIRGKPAPFYTSEEEAWIVQTLREHPDPRTLGLPQAGWTLKLVQYWLQQRFGRAPHLSKVHTLLRRHNLRPRTPQVHASEAKEEEIRHFREVIWPEVEQQAQAENAVVVFLDESQIRQDAVRLQTWSVRGTRPVVRVSGKRARLNIIGALRANGEFWYACFQGMLTGPRFVGFLREIQAFWPDQPLVVVTDRHPAHVAAAVEHAMEDGVLTDIDLVFLPGYCPRLAPPESVWSLLKHTVGTLYPIRSDEDLPKVVEFELQELQAQPQRLQRLFDHPDLALFSRLRTQETPPLLQMAA